MNIVDVITLVVLGISIAVGMYRGFVSSVLTTGGCLLSIGGGIWLAPGLVTLVRTNEGLTGTLLSYTDATSRIGDLGLALTRVESLTSDTIRTILEKVALPVPLDRILQVNLEKQVFAPSHMNQVGDYVSQTIVGACLNVLSFLICFAASFLLVSIVVNLIRAVFHFPALKHADMLAGGLLGFLRGILLCYVLFILVPLAETMLQVDMVTDLLSASTFAPVFNSGNLILGIMNGGL